MDINSPLKLFELLLAKDLDHTRLALGEEISAQRFLDTILTRGGSRDALEAFIEFRGRRPDVRALLKQHGIDA